MVTYAVAALAVDSLATANSQWLIDWSVFYWRLRYGFEISTTILWLVIPCALMFPHLDPHCFTFRRWKKVDALLLLILILAGAAGVLLIRYIPELNRYYASQAHLSPAMKRTFIIGNLAWITSWLIGWEFLHRVFLMRYLQTLLGKAGPCLIPVFEFVFHLQKSLPEAGGMLLLSAVLTYWSYRRRNVLLPLLAHLAIELTLVAYLVV